MLLSNTGTWMQIVAQWLPFSLLLVGGAAQVVTSSVSITLKQLNTPHDVMGFVMSINTFVIMGIRPLSAFPGGALSAVIGVTTAIASGAG